MRLDTKALGAVKVTARGDQADAREQVSLTRIDPRQAKEIPSPIRRFQRHSEDAAGRDVEQ